MNLIAAHGREVIPVKKMAATALASVLATGALVGAPLANAEPGPPFVPSGPWVVNENNGKHVSTQTATPTGPTSFDLDTGQSVWHFKWEDKSVGPGWEGLEWVAYRPDGVGEVECADGTTLPAPPRHYSFKPQPDGTLLGTIAVKVSPDRPHPCTGATEEYFVGVSAVPA